jgi:leucyl-tRNA synthetase
MGELSAGPEALDDFILIKSDGLPTYNFAHIVDDAEMGITHVIRGLEYISSIPKYLSLYDALDLAWPELVCLPHIMAPDGQKMSKSKGNVIDPMEIMDSGYGADALRVYEMFIAPYDMDAPWDTRGVPGTYRFLSRVWNLTQEFIEVGARVSSENNPGPSKDAQIFSDNTAPASVAPSDSVEVGARVSSENNPGPSKDAQIVSNNTTPASATILKSAHATIKKVTRDIEDEKFNTAVASMMEMVNTLYKVKESVGVAYTDEWRFALESLLQILAPFAPHITEELWHELG